MIIEECCGGLYSAHVWPSLTIAIPLLYNPITTLKFLILGTMEPLLMDTPE